MIPMRQSTATDQNSLLVDDLSAPLVMTKKGTPRGSPRGNVAWLRRARRDHGIGEVGDVVLLGGKSVVDFRIRVAQSHARHDLTPSYWSTVGVLASATRLITVPIASTGVDLSLIPASNAMLPAALSDFDDTNRYPNIAVVRFPGVDPTKLLEQADKLRKQRSIADLPALLIAWLGFVWGAGGSPNPLLVGLGHPSAVLVESLFGLVDVELTPGLASASSCPEAIWQSVKWWQDFYAQAVAGEPEDKEASKETSPWGRYRIRDREASYVVPREPEPFAPKPKTTATAKA
jgi:hypothetical protein